MAFSYQTYTSYLKIKDKKLFGRNLCFRQFYIKRKFELQGSFWWIKDPDPQHWSLETSGLVQYLW